MNVLDIANKNQFGMPRVRLFNTISHFRKIDAKLKLNSSKTILSHFFLSMNNIVSKKLHCFRFDYTEMRRKLCPKAPVKEGSLGQISKNFQLYFIHINFFKKPNKKIYDRAKKLYCVATIFVF